MKYKTSHSFFSGYTLVEALVASAIIMVAVGAAASLSLTTVRQEEISEKSVRATNYLENAATLYQLGFNGDQIKNLLPAETDVQLTITPATIAVANLGNVNAVEMNLSFSAGESAVRNHTIKVIKASY